MGKECTNLYWDRSPPPKYFISTNQSQRNSHSHLKNTLIRMTTVVKRDTRDLQAG